MDFQLENSLPQSNVIDLNRWFGTCLNHLFKLFSISIACLPLGFNVMMTFDNRSTSVITELL